ncbi:hypothetical protein HII17_05395 [Thalassotalea sp. M1531]|uniref:S9 family peptidase n=1 Tax=Thalassotalea algicola TaxID=2716224 RepID=A0A7Y0Q5G8_9GAMM|nr:hypothetical protein [Thalassotalea algicola]NMP30994.1 hypothetical protein [Thalassotalea algicola]
MMLKKCCIFFAFLLLTTVSYAAPQKDTQSKQQFYNAKISPDGRHLAVLMDVKGKRTLAFLDAKTMSIVGGAKLPRLSEVGEFFWGNSERVVMKVLKKEAWRPEPIYYGELFAVNIDGTKGEMIYGYRNLYERQARGAGSKFKKKKRLDGSAEIIDLLPNDERAILISSTLWAEGTHPSDTHWVDHGSRLASVYKLDIYNGQISTKRIAGGPVPYTTFMTDATGKLKASYGKDKQNEFYLKNEDGWQQVPSSMLGNNFTPLAINHSGDKLFALTNKATSTQLYTLNLANQEYTITSPDSELDIESANITLDGHDVYALLTKQAPIEYIVLNQDSMEAKIFSSLLNVFKNQEVTIVSKSNDDTQFVVKTTTGDNHKFYLYNLTTNKLMPLS